MMRKSLSNRLYRAKPKVIQPLAIFILLCSFSYGALAASWSGWPVVGTATFRWLLMDIYHSTLRTPSGQFQPIESSAAPEPLALEIEYLKTISGETLLKATDKQWQKQGIDEQRRTRWLRELTEYFPDVEPGDRLIYVLVEGRGEFYFHHHNTTRSIGVITDKELARAFLAIWIGINTRYPALRQKLIGVAK